MRANFLMPFGDALPTMPDGNGVDQIEAAGRLGLAPFVDGDGNTVLTNIVTVVAPEAVILALAELANVELLPMLEDLDGEE